jgi:predicted transcriptional regulator
MFNIRSRKPPTPLEQFIMDYVWAHPDCTAEMCREGLAGKRALKDSTIRTILRKLEDKGYVTHGVDGRTFVYRAADTRRNVAVEAAQQLIDRFCDGSVEELLVGLVDNQVLAPKQLQRLAAKIASQREKRA